MTIRVFRTVVALAVALLWAPASRAEPGAVVVNGRATAHEQTVASTALTDQLRAAGWVIAAKPLAAKEASAVTTCLTTADGWKCASRVARDKGLTRMVVLSLDPQQKDGVTTVVINARLILTSADSVFVSQRFCDHCTDDTLANLVREVTQELVDRNALHGGRTVLIVKSTPQGARFSIDGTSVGATDASIDTIPGHHAVRIELDGFEIAERGADAVEGTTVEVSVTLQRTPSKQKSPLGDGNGRPHVGEPEVVVTHRSRLVPALLIIGGGLAVIGGGVAIALDQDDDITKPATQDQPRYYYDTMLPGIASVAAGAVVVGFGGYLWWKYSKAAPIVAPVAGGAVAGVGGSF